MKCVLEFGKKKMGFGPSVYQNLMKKDEFWTKCVVEFGKKKMGFEQSVYYNLVKKRWVLDEVCIRIW